MPKLTRINNASLDKLYDSFPPGQTMSRADFKKEFKALMNPNQMAKDLEDITMMKARQRSAQIQIDRAIARGKEN